MTACISPRRELELQVKIGKVFATKQKTEHFSSKINKAFTYGMSLYEPNFTKSEQKVRFGQFFWK